jgi:hypothetical protein
VLFYSIQPGGVFEEFEKSGGVVAKQLPEFATQIEWQIDRRARIQRLLFDLLSFLKEHSEFPQEGDNAWYPMTRMVNAAFSLWRSAFLTDVKRERRRIYEHTIEFIEKVLTSNAITFADDHRLCELSVGYYNSNARYRIERMYRYNEDLLQLPSIQKIHELRSAQVESLPQDQMWDDFYLALVDCFASFKEHWNGHMRPHRQSPVQISDDGSKEKLPPAR